MWSSIWRICICASVFSKFTAKRISKKAERSIGKSKDYFNISEDLNPHSELRIYFSKKYPMFSWDLEDFRDPIDILHYILSRYTNINSLSADFLNIISLADMESELSSLLQNYGHMHFLIDGMDEFAITDPRGWLDVQMGLFKANFLTAAVRKYTQYVKVTVAIRNYIYARSAQDPQIDRAKSQILKLNWDKVAARKFLDLRLNSILGGNFAYSHEMVPHRPLATWLGFDSVYLKRRGKHECVEDYFLRHTRLSPRNIVEGFNSLCAVQNDKFYSGGRIDEAEFIEQTSVMARQIATTMLLNAAEEILANFSDIISIDGDKNRKFASETFKVTRVSDAIENFIRSCELEIINEGDFREKLSDFIKTVFAQRTSSELEFVSKEIVGIFWRSGIIAYASNGSLPVRWNFSWTNGELGYGRPPTGYKQVGFHSAMIDLVSIGVHKDGPVF